MSHCHHREGRRHGRAGVTCFALWLGLVLLALPAVGQEFTLKLTVSGFQVGQILLGCREGATPAYDRKLDIYVPPMAITGGVIGLKLEEDPMLLYQDMRPVEFPQTWRVSCKASGLGVLTWEPESLPEGLEFKLTSGIATYDMRRIRQVKVAKQTMLTITASLLKPDQPSISQPATHNSKEPK